MLGNYEKMRIWPDVWFIYYFDAFNNVETGSNYWILKHESLWNLCTSSLENLRLTLQEDLLFWFVCRVRSVLTVSRLTYDLCLWCCHLMQVIIDDTILNFVSILTYDDLSNWWQGSFWHFDDKRTCNIGMLVIE